MKKFLYSAALLSAMILPATAEALITVDKNGLVKAGGDVTPSGENILLAPGFKVETGGLLNVSSK